VSVCIFTLQLGFGLESVEPEKIKLQFESSENFETKVHSRGPQFFSLVQKMQTQQNQSMFEGF
jgi:hypothetical protein